MRDYSADNRLDFPPIGVWVADQALTFRIPRGGGSASACRDDSDCEHEFVGLCKQLDSIMESKGLSRIDVLKLNVEGAALPVLEHMANGHAIRPAQIVVEFERPRGDVVALSDYFIRVDRLLKTLSEYSVFRLPRRRARYCSVELLLVRRG